MRVSLTEAITQLKAGEVVAIPTETVYGLAADARNPDAIAQIYTIKSRPANNPLIVHLANASQVLDWATTFPPMAQVLANTFWPGPLTLVLPARDTVPQIVRANQATIALRVPAHPITQQLLQQSGLGLAAPSANKYTEISPTTPAHVEKSLGADIPVLDGGACTVGIESTIISVDNNRWQLLRQGMITENEITNICGIPADKRATHTPNVPGQHLLHYAPKTTTYLFDHEQALTMFAQQHPHCAILTFTPINTDFSQHHVTTLPTKPAKAAERLYDTLHKLDAEAHTHLLILKPPKTEQWAGIHDRLNRAAHQSNSHPS